MNLVYNYKNTVFLLESEKNSFNFCYCCSLIFLEGKIRAGFLAWNSAL